MFTADSVTSNPISITALVAFKPVGIYRLIQNQPINLHIYPDLSSPKAPKPSHRPRPTTLILSRVYNTPSEKSKLARVGVSSGTIRTYNLIYFRLLAMTDEANNNQFGYRNMERSQEKDQFFVLGSRSTTFRTKQT